MPVPGRTTPCAGCPWRTTSLRGYLGADDPVHFYWQSITVEGEMPCHEQVDYRDPDWVTTQLPGADYCAGMLIYYRNNLKWPRRPSVAEAVRLVRKSNAVFSWPWEFIRHHMPGASDEEVDAAWHRAQEFTDPDQD